MQELRGQAQLYQAHTAGLGMKVQALQTWIIAEQLGLEGPLGSRLVRVYGHMFTKSGFLHLK